MPPLPRAPAPTIKEHAALTLCGVRLHILPAPYRFDRRHNVPLVDEQPGLDERPTSPAMMRAR